MKLYIIIGFIVALLASYVAVYNTGKTVCRKEVQDAILKQVERENKLIKELEEARKKREIVYREKIKIIRETNDSCLDQPLHPDIKRLFDNDTR